MHIAHLQDYKSIGVEELAKRAGLKRRRIAQMARNGEIPGAIRLDGYHYTYPVTPELLDWIEWKHRKVQQRKHPAKTAKVKPTIGVITVHGMRQDFDIWKRRMGGLDGILKLDPKARQDIMIELQAIASLHSDLAKANS